MAELARVQLKVWIPAALRRRLKVLAAETGEAMSDLVAEAITTLLAKRGAK